ncbi:hypothetical protein [Proteus terrae]|uniref:hypothetical protein n=1 Tax=Proteus terrae TaxID=1574161 RepID=UPI00298D4E0C|nr:hypothetical protein [Proteus terrae]WPD00639.1 hypothetical protein R5P25_09060 [Proteus terrae]
MFDYINETYGLNIKKGDRVRYTFGNGSKEGTIVGVHAANLKIKMDGDNYADIYHPTWELEYL